MAQDLPQWCSYVDGFQPAEVNVDKTKLLWAGSRFNAEYLLGSKGLSVQIGPKNWFSERHGLCSVVPTLKS